WWPAAASARAFAITGDASWRRWSRSCSFDIGGNSSAYQPTDHSMSASATTYSLKCGSAYVNDFSCSDCDAVSLVHAAASPSRYHRPRSCASSCISVLSATPSPFRSPLAPPYHIVMAAGAPNSRPVGSSETPILLVSTRTVTRTESPMASWPTPGTNWGSVVVSVRNG